MSISAPVHWKLNSWHRGFYWVQTRVLGSRWAQKHLTLELQSLIQLNCGNSRPNARGAWETSTRESSIQFSLRSSQPEVRISPGQTPVQPQATISLFFCKKIRARSRRGKWLKWPKFDQELPPKSLRILKISPCLEYRLQRINPKV